ncbi:alfa-L-rhamnosidase [Niveomyces insectorum RCEF 264]|uniref:alpha-L-rhamnosidase n=1 Tax=Niveomyces insectorum RCEF 264 TaxID=1081102 RepID=A0A167P3U3_9HYPO|nr:alfa-L-rhamnosidase [Niveomyces insectorum RCEF 264]
MSVSIAQLTAEHHHDGFGLFTPSPRLSWRFNPTTHKGWRQVSYDIAITRNGKDEAYHVDSAESVLVPWPSTPLSSREIVQVKARAHGADGLSTAWAQLTVEAALFERANWTAKLISGPPQAAAQTKRPFRLRKEFTAHKGGRARLYATAHGLYEVEINGTVVGNHVLAPGWQSYQHRLHYQTYDVTDLLHEGTNVIGAYVGEGWFAGRLGRPGTFDIFGNRLGFLGQLEIDGQVVAATDNTWGHLDGPLLASEIYNGEIFDSTLDDPNWSKATSTSMQQSGGKAQEITFPEAELIAPHVAPVRRVMEIRPQAVITTPKGKKVLDFGQNLVGWLRIEQDLPGKPGDELRIRHAEVLEHGELGTRPLRTAKAEDIVKLGGKTKGHEPRFTFHGFRYAEISGLPEDAALTDIFTAVVVTSDLRRTGTFTSSHALVNKLHENTVWSTRGNFVSVPTDCPQRDERLGWTGDLQVFAPTANYLYDTAAFLGSWLRDVHADQVATGTGVVPIVVPAIPMSGLLPGRENRPMAVWADCAVLTPWDLYTAFGDRNVLETQWASMRLWLDQGVPRGPSGLYDDASVQYGDWLDPRAPPALPGHCPTDPRLVADAYLVHVTQLTSQIAGILGKKEEAQRYGADAARLLAAFHDTYVTPKGRLVSDTQTGYALALRFGLLSGGDRLDTARGRLDFLTRWELFRITTGFAGTPIILQVLADNGMLNLAYRMLQERDDPSWLYPVRMGATTIWERWNSMLPDGTINPGQMTSFNHYALGSVCAFLHGTVGGLSPAEPGWKSALVQPRPGGTIRHASTSFDSPYGLYSVHWRLDGGKLIADVAVPPNGQAKVVLPGIEETVGSGEYHYEAAWQEEPDWPPAIIQGSQGLVVDSEFVP